MTSAAFRTLGVVATVAGLAVTAALVNRSGELPSTAAVKPAPSQVQPAPKAIRPAPKPVPKPECSSAGAPFVPSAVSLSGVGKRIPVLALRPDASGVPGVPPISDDGKRQLAFDLGSGILPGGPRGNALLNAHTWPDGSALGNRLLAKLDEGDRIVVHGALGRLCYEVTERTEVPADSRSTGYYRKKGKPQVAIVVCSGERLGPGEWTKRTLWFASPVT